MWSKTVADPSEVKFVFDILLSVSCNVVTAALDRIFVEVFLLSTTNKMQRYTILFIIVNALRVSGGFSAHHQELKNCTHSIWYVPGLLAATASS